MAHSTNVQAGIWRYALASGCVIALIVVLYANGLPAWVIGLCVVLCIVAAMACAARTGNTPAAGGGTSPSRSADRVMAQSGTGEISEEVSRRLRAVFDASPVASMVTSASGVITLANPAASALMRRPLDRLLGRTLEQVVTHSGLLSCHAEAMQGHGAGCEVRMNGGGVSMALDAWCQPIPGGGAVVTLRDVTEHSRTLQLRTEFVANASHELRTPLASLRLASETLETGAWRDESMRTRLLGIIASNVQRLEELTRDLLDLSRIEQADTPQNMVDVDLESLVRSLRDRFEPIMRERRVSIDTRLHEHGRVIRTDPRLFEPILTNLVDNALKFAREGTSVIVESEPLSDGTACLRVIDKGVGIPLEQQARIFERFYQVDVSRDEHAPRRGTGLGLAIVRHAVRALGGSVRVESVWQQGTTMIVELPGASTSSQRVV